MFALDLDEIDVVARRAAGFSRNRWNLYSFRDRDHVSIVPGTVKENVTAYLAQNGVTLPDGARVLLLTLPRILGYIFNPVSFYFCTDASGQQVCAVAEVGNTFGEMKLYLLGTPAADGVYRLIAPKHFYVSPFSKLDVEFDFKLRDPGEELEIHIDDREGERRTLLSALTGRRVPLTSARLAWLTLKYPLLTLRVIFLIHWNALLLWRQGTPWFGKTARPEDQRAVLRPHASLARRAP